MNGKKGLVLLGHGSRSNNSELISLVPLVREISGFAVVSFGFLEHAEPDIPTGIASAYNEGASLIYAVPMLLFPAAHKKKDFPEQVEIARKNCPNANIVLTEHLGVDDKILSIVMKRVLAQSPSLSPGEAILLIGRGSKDNMANAELVIVIDRLERLLAKRQSVTGLIVEFCFLDLAEPDIRTGIETCLAQGAGKVNIIPYFLFDGVLIQRIKKIIDGYAEEYDIPLRLGDYIGVDQLLAETVVDRALACS